MKLNGTHTLPDKGLLNSQESLDSLWLRADNLVLVCTGVQTIKARVEQNCAGSHEVFFNSSATTLKKIINPSFLSKLSPCLVRARPKLEGPTALPMPPLYGPGSRNNVTVKQETLGG